MKPLETVSPDRLFYHGTMAPRFDTFHPFAHFGTRRAAVEMLAARRHLDHVTGLPLIYCVTTSAVGLLRIEDFDSPDPNVWRARLRAQGLITQDEHDELQDALFRTGIARATRHERFTIMAAWLEERAIDGFIYANAHEDRGSDSISVVSPGDLKVWDVEQVSDAELLAVWGEIRAQLGRPER